MRQRRILWVSEGWDSAASHDASILLPAVKNAVPHGKAIVASFERVAVTNPEWGVGPERTHVRCATGGLRFPRDVLVLGRLRNCDHNFSHLGIGLKIFVGLNRLRKWKGLRDLRTEASISFSDRGDCLL